MQKKSFITSLIVTAVAGSSVLFSGCSQAAVNTPAAELHKSFKSSVSSTTFGKAVQKAASEQGWSLSKVSADTSNYQLKKVFVQNHHDMMEADELHHVNVDVAFADNKMNLKVTDMSMGASAVFNSQQELRSLEKAINKNLILALKATLQNGAFDKVIKKAAVAKGWTVTNIAGSTSAYRLEKNYLQTHYDMMEASESHRVTIEVTFTDDKINFKLADMTQGASGIFHADQEFASLEKAINQNILMSIQPSYNQEEFGKAIEQAAAIKGWSVSKVSADKSTYRLKKAYTQSHHDMMEADEYYDIYVDVIYANDKMNIKMADMTKEIPADFHSEQEIISLEKAINQKLCISAI
jgi:hypothetical protein